MHLTLNELRGIVSKALNEAKKVEDMLPLEKERVRKGQAYQDLREILKNLEKDKGLDFVDAFDVIGIVFDYVFPMQDSEWDVALMLLKSDFLDPEEEDDLRRLEAGLGN